MPTFSRALAAVVVSLALAGMVLGSTGLAAAQTDGQTNTTTTESEPESTLIQVDQYVRVIDYSYSGGEFVIELEAEIPSLVTVSDALGPVADEGASEIPQRQYTVDGRETIVMDVEEFRGSAAVSVATPDGGIYLSTGVSAPNPFSLTSSTTGWLGGAFTVVLMAVLALIKVSGETVDEPTPVEGGT